MVAVGLAKTLAAVDEFNPVAGVHTYDVAPVAVKLNVVGFVEQLLTAFGDTWTFGAGVILTVIEDVCEAPQPSVIITV